MKRVVFFSFLRLRVLHARRYLPLARRGSGPPARVLPHDERGPRPLHLVHGHVAACASVRQPEGLGGGPDPYQAKPSWFMEDMGHHPYLSKQPNGYSDLSEDWMSPELIIRRLIYARQGYINLKPDNKNNEFFEKVVNKNFDNPDKILKILKQNEKPIDRHILLFNLPEVFRA